MAAQERIHGPSHFEMLSQPLRLEAKEHCEQVCGQSVPSVFLLSESAISVLLAIQEASDPQSKLAHRVALYFVALHYLLCNCIVVYWRVL